MITVGHHVLAVDPWSDGDEFRVDGRLRTPRDRDAELLAREFLGYAGEPDRRPYMPHGPVRVTSDTKPSINGLYEVIRPEVSPMQAGSSVQRMRARWNAGATLRRLGRDGSAVIESRLRGGMRPEAYDLFNLAASQMWEWWAIPTEATGVDMGVADIDATWVRTGPGGSVKAYRSEPAQIYRGSSRYGLTARNWYSMAAQLSSSGLPVVAEDSPLPVDDWCLSNGLIRVAPTSTGVPQIAGPDGVNSTSWAAPYTMTMWYYDSIVVPLGVPVAAQSVRTAPNESAVRLTFAPLGVPTHVYISLRRGALGVVVSWGTRKAGGVRWGLGDGTDLNVVSHSFGGDPVDIGVETDDLDATGNRMCVIPTTEWGVVLSPSGDAIMTDTASQQALWHVGWVPDGAGSNDRTVAQMKMFFFAADERLRVLR